MMRCAKNGGAGPALGPAPCPALCLALFYLFLYAPDNLEKNGRGALNNPPPSRAKVNIRKYQTSQITYGFPLLILSFMYPVLRLAFFLWYFPCMWITDDWIW